MAERSSTFYLGMGCGIFTAFTLLCLGCGGGVFAGVRIYMVRQPVVIDAVEAVSANEEAVARLGTPVEVGWWVQGTVSTGNEGGTADLIVPVEGPQGEAILSIVAEKDAEAWHYQTLNLVFANGGGAIDLVGSLVDNPDVQRTTKVTRLLDEAEAKAGEGDFAGAIALCTEALAEEPENFRGHALRGRAKADAEDFAGAKVDLRKAAELDPSDTATRLRLGAVETALGDHDACIAAFTEVLRLDSRSGEAWLGRAVCYEGKGELRQAVAGAREACDQGLAAGCEMAARLEPNQGR